MADVIAFPVKPVDVEPANDVCDGPPLGIVAWQCLNCEDEDDQGMQFYITPDGIFCWTCRAAQTFD